jgi:phosphoribosylanthranilate isomerase
MSRIRIKICGITREEDARCASSLGADALGFVFYPPSPRFVSTECAQQLARVVKPFVTLVGLFVNADVAAVREVLAAVPIDVLQFHGEESAAYCEQFDRPYIKAARVLPGLDLLEYAASFPSARGLLLDAYAEGYGGGGKTFDWQLIPEASLLSLPLILSGGLNAGNLDAALTAVKPWAVDVSSGVESAAGIKDAKKMAEFIAGVRSRDA